jgi:sarcosine oxidase subunit alpha
VGKRSLELFDLVGQHRKQLVGLLTKEASIVAEEGAQVLASPHLENANGGIGFITSSYWSDTCGRSIALALVADGRKRKRQTVFVTTEAGLKPAEIVDPVFFDPTGERINA